MLTDGQVGIFKDRSAAAMSTFGDILPAQAAGLLSSFTAPRSDSWWPNDWKAPPESVASYNKFSTLRPSYTALL
jgi:hypothetical protein